MFGGIVVVPFSLALTVVVYCIMFFRTLAVLLLQFCAILHVARVLFSAFSFAFDQNCALLHIHLSFITFS